MRMHLLINCNWFNMRIRNLAGIVLFVLAAGTAAASADEAADPQTKHSHIRFGGLVVGAGYSSGPVWYGGGDNGWNHRFGLYDPFWYSPYIHSGLYSGFMQQPNMGQVKLAAVEKDASVYLDGAYAGSAQKLKSFWLAPGVYNLELRDDTQRTFRQRVYVLSGRTLSIRPKLQSEVAK